MEVCIKVDAETGGNGDTLTLLNKILQNQSTIMELIDDLKTEIAGLKQQVTDLQTSLDAEQEQIAELIANNAQVVTDLNTQIATLQAQLEGSANPAQLQEVIDSIAAIRDSITTTKADLEGTV